MSIVAFAGPSLPPQDRAGYEGVEWRPPAEAGDLLRLDARPATTVCLIDGYFDHRPAVRHKELLLLLAEGVRIIGASSIGALRAAEMEDFGMAGIGAIYGAYARGALEGDDEVALIHAGIDRGWRPLSLPLVDVRATLCRMRRHRLLAGDEARALLRAASGIHYVDRTWTAIVDESRQRQELKGLLRQWTVPLKRIDANLCLRAAMVEPRSRGRRPVLVRTPFLDWLGEQCGALIEARCQALARSGIGTSPFPCDRGPDWG